MARSVSRPEQAFWLGRLDELAYGVAQLGLDQPVLIGIGEVFANAAEAGAMLSDACSRAA